MVIVGARLKIEADKATRLLPTPAAPAPLPVASLRPLLEAKLAELSAMRTPAVARHRRSGRLRPPVPIDGAPLRLQTVLTLAERLLLALLALRLPEKALAAPPRPLDKVRGQQTEVRLKAGLGPALRLRPDVNAAPPTFCEMGVRPREEASA